MSADIGVRRATVSDRDALVGFNVAMALETEGVALDVATVDAGVGGLIAHPEFGFYLVGEVAGAVIAGLMVTHEWSDWRNGVFWWVQSVYVVPEHRGRGVYSRMYGAVKSMARAAGGVCGCRLYVERDNLRAQAVYRRLGMDETPYRLFEEVFSATARGHER